MVQAVKPPWRCTFLTHLLCPRPPSMLQPAVVKAFVDKVLATPLDRIADALQGFTWQFEKVGAQPAMDSQPPL